MTSQRRQASSQPGAVRKTGSFKSGSMSVPIPFAFGHARSCRKAAANTLPATRCSNTSWGEAAGF